MPLLARPRNTGITVLNDNYYFIGSILDDCVLGRVDVDFLRNLDHFKVLKRFSNRSAVHEFCDLKSRDGRGETNLMACRVPGNKTLVHKSMYVANTNFATSFTRLSNAWVLRMQKEQAVIVSTKHMTKTYVVNSAGLAITRKANPASFDECAQTIYCCNLGHSTVQVTGSSVACFKPGKSSLWQAGFRRIVAASGNGQKLALTLTDRRLVCIVS